MFYEFLSLSQFLSQFRAHKKFFSVRTYLVKNLFYDNILSTLYHNMRECNTKIFVVDLVTDFVPPVGHILQVRQRIRFCQNASVY